MAYVQVEADDRLEEGPEGLQFKSFLGADASAHGVSSAQRSPGVGNTDRRYISDEANQRKGSGSFWNIEYYQPYFDIDTKTVLERCYTTLMPWTPSFRTYFSSSLNPPDLYGPFWTLTTLIFALYLSSSLAASITSYMSPVGADPFDYDFGLLSIAVSLVYLYGLALPVLLWLGLRYLGVGEWSVVEAVAVWGYSQFVWIPVSFLCVIPVRILRYVLVGIAWGLSGYFLGLNVYPILASAEAKATRLLIILLAALHTGIAIAFKVLFFSYYIKVLDGAPGGDTKTGGGSGAGNSTNPRWL
ncbi:Protein YIPF1 [Psilocybe cubensis]|nr:Protein YIPF1 [Psilocybe cubensis]KAH9474570.1 Protein YIPF1 [Psilocybe cubensis]